MGALVAAGKITKLFGDGGEVVMNLYDTFPAEINTEGEPLFVRIESLTVPLFLNRFERRGKSGAVAGIDDIDTVRRAESLLGLEIYIKSEGADSAEELHDDEIYMENFVGFTVKFKNEKFTGVIESFIESDHNPLFEISINGKEVLVPASNDFIVKYSLRKREINLNLPEGLLELYI